MNADALNLDELDYDEDEPVAAQKITNGHPAVVELQSDDEEAKNNRKSSVDQPDDKSDDGALSDSDDGEIKSGKIKKKLFKKKCLCEKYNFDFLTPTHNY